MRVPTLDQIEARAKRNNISMAQVLRRANVDYSTWSRNKNGNQDFNTRTLRKILNALIFFESASAFTHVRTRTRRE